MESTRRVTRAAALLFVALPCLSAEPPKHYFTGRVCRGGQSVSFQPGDVPCEHPLRDVSVTLHNSRGLVIRTKTGADGDRKSTRLNSSHLVISYAVFCLKKKKN